MTDELQEKIIWQNINSSKNKGKILKGNIIAIEIEKVDNKNIVCAIVDFKGIKVIIPATELIKGGKNDRNTVRSMMGAEIRFVVIEVDEISTKAIGSRNKAMEIIQDINIKKIYEDDKIYSKILSVWKKNIRIEVLGFDFLITAQNLQYGYVEDLRKIYKINDQLKVLIKKVDKENKKIEISVKELMEDPFKNIRKDFTEGGEYLASITGYTNNGIYANISQGVDSFCLLPSWLDKPPMPGDKVILRISKISVEKRRIYSVLVRVLGSDADE